MNMKFLTSAFGLGLILFAVLTAFLFFTATVETGNVGVITNFGKVTGAVLDSGWHLVGPVDHVTEISIRTITTQTDATCFSSDLQAGNITLAVQTRITKKKPTAIYNSNATQHMRQ